jgi:NADPH:quinone reductase-like Zn-dependent oxidoreductase
MRAIQSPKAGPPEVLQYAEVARPTPKAGEILVKVHYATVTAGDVNLRRFNRLFLAVVGSLLGFRAMKIPGVEYAGEVEETGSEVTGFSRGDAVAGTTTGLAYGANAEYVCVPEHGRMCVIAHKPEGVGFREAAACVVGGMTAVQLLARGGVKAGDSVLVYGASGSVGSYAVQLAKHYGAEVTAVCSAANKELVASLGVDHVIDYASEDFRANGRRYDVIFDAVGKLRKSTCADSLAHGGRWTSVRSLTKEVADELDYVLARVASGEIRPLVDREYALEEVAEAHRYVETGRKRGNVVVRV